MVLEIEAERVHLKEVLDGYEKTGEDSELYAWPKHDVNWKPNFGGYYPLGEDGEVLLMRL